MKNKILILFFSTLSLITFFSYLFIDQNFPYLHSLYFDIAPFRHLITCAYVFLLSLLFVCYFFLLRQTKELPTFSPQLKKNIGITVLILLFAFPTILSYDIFSYIAYAKVLVVYHENPYIIMPYQLLGDPILPFTRYANITSVYGPSWTLLSVFPYLLGFGNYLLILFNFKLVASAFYLGTVYLLWKLSKSSFVVTLFAFNPLILLQFLVSGHNDIVMMFMALLSYYLLQKKYVWWALLALLVSIGVKYVTIVLLPLFILAAYRQKMRKTNNWDTVYAASGLFMLAMFLLSYLHRQIYPWYVVWFLVFTLLVPKYKVLFYLSLTLSATLLLADVPYMFSGTYHAVDQVLNLLVIFLPLGGAGIFYLKR